MSEKLQLEAQGSHAGLVRFDQILAVLLSLKMSPIERDVTFYFCGFWVEHFLKMLLCILKMCEIL